MQRSRFRQLAGGGVVAVLLVVAIVSSVGDGSSEAAGGGDQVVAVALAADPASLDPAFAQTQTDATVAWAMYDTLVSVDDEGVVTQHLAEEWSRTAESVTFTLRPDVVCDDGSVLAASDVAASINRLVDSETASPVPGILWPGLGIEAQADDVEQTVTVAASAPWADLLIDFAHPATGIVCPAGLADPAELARTSSGTGPFVSGDVRRGQRYVLERRDDYAWGPPSWESGSGERPDIVHLDVVSNESTVVNLLRSGDLHAAVLVGPDSDRLQGADDFRLVEQAVGTTFVQFNEAPGRPLADPAVRSAVAMAIDRAAFARAAFGERAELLSTIAAPTAECSDTSAINALPAFDPAAALEALGPRDLELHVLGTTQIGGGTGTEYIRAALQAAGVEATLTNTDTTTWVSELFGGGGDWDVTVMAVGGIILNVRNPASHFAGEPPPDGSNIPSLDEPSFQAAFDTATQLVGDASCDSWIDAQRILTEGTHTIPLTTIPAVVAFTDDVSGHALNGILRLGAIRR